MLNQRLRRIIAGWPESCARYHHPVLRQRRRSPRGPGQAKSEPQAIYFGADGKALIATLDGLRVPANWSANNGQLCLAATGSQECWTYGAPFQTGKVVVLTSDCGQQSIFLPLVAAK